MRGSAAFRAAVAPGGVLAGPWVKNELWRRARAVPSLDLRFADDKSLRDAVTGQQLITFTRASSGTFVGSDGVLRTATTNLLLRSEEFDDAGWTKSAATVTANAGIAPNGTLTADKFIPNTTNAFHFMVRGANVASGATITYSVYAKADGYSFLLLNTSFGSTGGNAGPLINLSNGTKAGFLLTDYPTQIQSIGNGWYRISFQFTSSTTFAQVDYNPFPTSSVATYAGDGTAGVLLWGAQLEQSSTVGEYIPTTSTINSAPRFDHNPTTGESLGLLVEEQRTNSIRNNTMVGAVAGTPGTLPTNWSYFAATTGLTASIVGTGVESGINYIDLRLNGTAGSTSPSELAIDLATAATGQSWTFSTYWRVASGSTSGISSFQLGQIELNSGQGFVAGAFVDQTAPTVSGLHLQRASYSRTLSGGATVAFVASRVRIVPVNGATIDITLRIGMPQLEQGAFATSVIPTTTATVTRSADVASITGTAFSSWYRQDEGSFFCSTAAPKGTVVFGTGDTFDNTQYVTVAASNNVSIRSAGSDQAVLTAPVSSSANTNVAFRYALNSFAAVSNGGIVSTDSSGAVPLAQVRLKLGSSAWSPNPGNDINGTIRRLAYWGQRLPNNVLQAITQ